MILPLLLCLLSSAASPSDDWCGLTTSKVYVTTHQPRLAFVFEPEQRRVLASLFNAELLGAQAVGYIADSTVVDHGRGSYAIDIVWDESLGGLFRGQSVLIVDGGQVSLDAALPLEVSDIELDTARFTDAKPEVAQVRWLDAAPLEMFMTRFHRIDEHQDVLLMLPSTRQVLLANGEGKQHFCRGWLLPTLREDRWRIQWEDPTASPDGLPHSELRISGKNIAMRVQGYRQALFERQTIGKSAMGNERNASLILLRDRLLGWQRRAGGWHGWIPGGVYKFTSGASTEHCLWVNPEKMEAHIATFELGQFDKRQSARGRIVRVDQLLDGSYLTDVAWEDGVSRTTYRATGDTVRDVASSGEWGGYDDYELSSDLSGEHAKRFDSVLPLPMLTDESLSYPKPGTVFTSGSNQIVVLDSGRDVLVKNSFIKGRALLVVGIGSHEGHSLMGFVQQEPSPATRAQYLRWYLDGGTLVFPRRSGNKYRRNSSGSLIRAQLEKQYGIWSDD